MSHIEKGYSSEQAKLPEFLENPTVSDMVPGNIFGINEDDLIIGSDRKCWVDGDAGFYKEFESWDEETLTLIRINEGFIIDLSTLQDKEPRFSLTTTMDIIKNDNENLLPVIGFIISTKDLLDFDKQYRAQTGKRYLSKELRKSAKKQLKKNQEIGEIALNNK